MIQSGQRRAKGRGSLAEHIGEELRQGLQRSEEAPSGISQGTYFHEIRFF
jgi:hypothetical protein